MITSPNIWLKLSLAVLVLGTTSCRKEAEFPVQPVIKSAYVNAQQELVVTFTDGDGDIGLSSDDIYPPYQQFLDEDSTQLNPYYYNLWVDYYELVDGVWQPVELASTLNFRLPVITPTGQNKQIEATINYDLSELAVGTDRDSIKYSVVLVDRALNTSEVVETPLFVIP